MRAEALDEFGDVGEIATHEPFEQDVEGFGRRLLFAHDQLRPRLGARVGEHARHAFDKPEQQRDAGLALRCVEFNARRCRGQMRLDQCHASADARLDLFGNELENRQIQPFLAAKVIADQCLIGVGGVGDFAIAGGVETIAGELGDGRFDECAPGGFAAVGKFRCVVHGVELLFNRLIKSTG